MTDDTLISSGWHWQYGWMRRPELDDNNGYCYEEPDGNLVFTPLLRHRKAMRLACWFDHELQENYLVISHVPCAASKYAR